MMLPAMFDGLVVELGDRNPGGLRVCCELARAPGGESSLRRLKELGFRGSDIWVAYKDAGCDLAKLQAALASKDPAMVAAVESER